MGLGTFIATTDTCSQGFSGKVADVYEKIKSQKGLEDRLYKKFDAERRVGAR